REPLLNGGLIAIEFGLVLSPDYLFWCLASISLCATKKDAHAGFVLLESIEGILDAESSRMLFDHMASSLFLCYTSDGCYGTGLLCPTCDSELLTSGWLVVFLGAFRGAALAGLADSADAWATSFSSAARTAFSLLSTRSIRCGRSS